MFYLRKRSNQFNGVSVCCLIKAKIPPFEELHKKNGLPCENLIYISLENEMKCDSLEMQADANIF